MIYIIATFAVIEYKNLPVTKSEYLMNYKILSDYSNPTYIKQPGFYTGPDSNAVL